MGMKKQSKVAKRQVKDRSEVVRNGDVCVEKMENVDRKGLFVGKGCGE